MKQFLRKIIAILLVAAFLPQGAFAENSVSLSIKVKVIDPPPEIIITSPKEGTVLEENKVTLSGTIDGEPFFEERTLTQEGENTLTKTATDLAGNTSSASVKVWLYLGSLIGPEGGEVSSFDAKVKLIVPEGALDTPKRIRILGVKRDLLQGALLPNKNLLSVVECKPSGTIFKKPASLVYTLPEAEVPGTPVELSFYDTLLDKLIPTGQIAQVPVDGYTLNFLVSHFSTYAALKSLTPQGPPIGQGVKIPLPDMLTGSFSHSIPLTVPPGRKGMQPSLGLSYRSSNPNSWTGVGFSLNPGYIVRSTRLGPPTYNDTQDTFYFITEAGTSELVHLIDNLYQAKVESSFTKFFKETDDSWRVVSKDGSLLRFGTTTDSKETSRLGTFSWYLTRAQDTNGNYLELHYLKDQGKSYLKRIDYTGNEEVGFSPTNSVEFILEPREDISSSYLSGSKIATKQRLKGIHTKVNSELVWRYELEYAYSEDTNRSLLKSITQYGSDGKSLPTQRLTYQKAR